MSRIDTVNALLTCLENFLNIWDNANKLYIMLPCAWIFYIWPAVICFMCNVIVKIAAAHWPHRKQETNYTTVRGCWGLECLSLMKFWNSEEKLSKVHELSWTVNELCTCLIIEEKDHLRFTKLVKDCEIIQMSFLKKSSFCSL